MKKLRELTVIKKAPEVARVAMLFPFPIIYDFKRNTRVVFKF